MSIFEISVKKPRMFYDRQTSILVENKENRSFAEYRSDRTKQAPAAVTRDIVNDQPLRRERAKYPRNRRIERGRAFDTQSVRRRKHAAPVRIKDEPHFPALSAAR